MEREIIKIDEELCNGCGLCVPNCHEGALQIIDGKARLVSELMCDGLGACIGHCPEGAITIEKREAEAYDEERVMEEILPKGINTIRAHLAHLKEHNEHTYLRQGLQYLIRHKSELDFNAEELISQISDPEPTSLADKQEETMACGCPGSAARTFRQESSIGSSGTLPSMLTHWPVQMHLINPAAAHFRNSHLLVAADCTAFSMGSFHRDFLKGKTLAIACPKLDSNRDIYVEKMIRLIDESHLDMMTVLIMEVPCCSGLVQLVEEAMYQCNRQIPVKVVTIGVQGEIQKERWARVG